MSQAGTRPPPAGAESALAPLLTTVVLRGFEGLQRSPYYRDGCTGSLRTPGTAGERSLRAVLPHPHTKQGPYICIMCKRVHLNNISLLSIHIIKFRDYLYKVLSYTLSVS